MIVRNTDTRRRLWRTLLVAGIVAIGLTVDDADAALIPSVSEELRGRPLPSFESQTLDGQPFSSRDLVGKPVIVNFFASWCPVCSMELKDLQTLQLDLRNAGFRSSRCWSIRWRRRTRSMRRASSSRAIRFPSPS